MKWHLTLGAAALALPVCAIEHADTYQRTFPLAGSERKLVIENINGYIRVTGDSGNDVRVVVRERFRADTQEQLAQARNDVRLEMRQEGSTIRLFLDGPFRDRERWGRRRDSYHFRHDFEVQVPRDIALALKTINGEEVKVANVRGAFDLRNINGRIEAYDIAGHGTAETINGPVRVTFTENPAQASRFKTLNGQIDVTFQPTLSADLKLSTMHGDAYTDFEVTPVAGGVETRRTGEGSLYRISDRSRTVRVGGGGNAHEFHTLNGSIRIRKYGKHQ